MDFISRFIEQHQLPDSFRAVAEEHYLPLCQRVKSALLDRKADSNRPLVMGVNGAQGTGKSTLADFAAGFLQSDGGANGQFQVAVVSIDDFYLTRTARKELAEKVHPLLITRGVPGTHDLPLALDVMGKLIDGESSVALPRFDKSVDDRAPQSLWPVTTAAVDLVILEGWCVGSTPEPEHMLEQSVNDLEEHEDADGHWRSYVNGCLANEYQGLYGLIDFFVLLKAPSFDAVYRWRLEQEQKLQNRVGEGAVGVMDKDQVGRFIKHYERLTRHNLKVLPEKADIVLELDENHQVRS